ncbi:MAG: hypothetical protein MHM6MM_004497 [Cercozoa sp. M6MM]
MGLTSSQVTQHNDSDANILKPLTTVLFKMSDTVSGKMLAPMMLCLLVLMWKLRGGARLPSEVNTDGLDAIPGIDKCDVGMAFARESTVQVLHRVLMTKCHKRAAAPAERQDPPAKRQRLVRRSSARSGVRGRSRAKN